MKQTHPPIDSNVFGFRIWYQQLQPLLQGMPLPHVHDEIELNYLIEGQMTYLLGGQYVSLEAGAMAVFWAASPHQLLASAPGTRGYWATIPLAWVLDWQLPSSFVSAMLGGQLLTDPRPLPWDQPVFSQWADEWHCKSNPKENHKTMTPPDLIAMELRARLHRMAHHLAESEPRTHPPLPTGPIGKVIQMAHLLVAHSHEAVHIEQIARQVHLHPNYAMKLFRQHAGITLNQFLTRHRISCAQRLLIRTDQGVIDIALQCGFGSVSRFYEAFKRHCHQTPRQYRLNIQSQIPPAPKLSAN